VSLTIAVAQPGVLPYHVDANVSAHADAVRRADARVVVFPELSLTGYELDAPAVAVDDPRLGGLVVACAERGTLALAGAPVADPDGEHIAVLAVDGGGARVAYRKVHLGDEETVRFVPGVGPGAITVDGRRLGLAVCKDSGVADHAARTAALGVTAYLAGVLEAGDDAPVVAERAMRIATTYGVHVAIASFAGPAGGGFGRGAGGSGVWGPDGRALVRAGPDAGDVVTARIADRERSHHDLAMSGSARVWIGVPPDVAYAAVADLRRMGEWSPEARGGTWVEGEAGTVGATFRGVNEDAEGPWHTISRITEAVPGVAFGWRVADPGQVDGTEWRFTFRPEGAGTVVTESFSWQWTPVPAEGFRGRVGRLPFDAAREAVAAKEAHLRAGITATVANLKAALEAG
jgi:predicted amidohydrolase